MPSETLPAERLNKRKAIASLEAMMMAAPDDIKNDYHVEHFFAPGVYVRQLFVPKGEVVVGKIHKTQHVTIISYGHVLVVTENGQQEIRGPHTFINQPGDKRAVVTLEDTLWTTIHPTNETDLAKIEEEVIAKDYTELEGPQQTLRIEE